MTTLQRVCRFDASATPGAFEVAREELAADGVRLDALSVASATEAAPELTVDQARRDMIERVRSAASTPEADEQPDTREDAQEFTVQECRQRSQDAAKNAWHRT